MWKVEIYIMKVEIYGQNSDFLSSLSELHKNFQDIYSLVQFTSIEI